MKKKKFNAINPKESKGNENTNTPLVNGRNLLSVRKRKKKEDYFLLRGTLFPRRRSQFCEKKRGKLTGVVQKEKKRGGPPLSREEGFPPKGGCFRNQGRTST